VSVGLARQLALIASDLESRGYEHTGPLRQAARLLVGSPDDAHGLDDEQTAGEPRCGWCGGPLVRQARGRPRRWCSARCRRAAQRPKGRNVDEMAR
jgi:hypothetical protein